MRNSGARRRNIGVALGAAAALTAVALFNRSKARNAEKRMPPLGRFVTVDGVRLHYVERGQGRPVVLLHGNGAMVQDMMVSGIFFDAAERYRVIAFDRPGFGYSERPRGTVWTPSAQAELLHKALAQLGIVRPIVIGHSWGTLVALAMALDHPRDVASIVLLSGYYFPTARKDVALSSPTAAPVLGDVLSYTVSPLLGRAITSALLKKLFAPAPIPKRFHAFPVDIVLRPGQLRASAADSTLMVPAAAWLSRRYDEIHLPVIIVAGDGDRIVDFHRQSERLHQAIASSILVRVPGAGHMVHHTAPDQVLAAIDAAAKRSAAG